MIEVLLSAHASLALLAANIAVSVAGFNNPKLIERLLLDVGAMRRRNEWYRMLTSGFVHGGPGHLLMNMFTLFFFGPQLEVALGTESFLLIYFASLLAGSAWAYMENFRDLNYRALGASGAISGIMVAFALFAPFVMIFVFFVPMPAILFAVLYIVYSAYASGGGRNDGIGHGAHLGGALMGLVLVCIFWPGAVRELWPSLLRILSGDG